MVSWRELFVVFHTFCYSPKDSVLKGADSIIEKAQFTFVKGHDGNYKKYRKYINIFKKTKFKNCLDILRKKLLSK